MRHHIPCTSVVFEPWMIRCASWLKSLVDDEIASCTSAKPSVIDCLAAFTD